MCDSRQRRCTFYGLGERQYGQAADELVSLRTKARTDFRACEGRWLGSDQLAMTQFKSAKGSPRMPTQLTTSEITRAGVGSISLATPRCIPRLMMVQQTKKENQSPKLKANLRTSVRCAGFRNASQCRRLDTKKTSTSAMRFDVISAASLRLTWLTKISNNPANAAPPIKLLKANILAPS